MSFLRLPEVVIQRIPTKPEQAQIADRVLEPVKTQVVLAIYREFEVVTLPGHMPTVRIDKVPDFAKRLHAAGCGVFLPPSLLVARGGRVDKSGARATWK